MVSLGYKMEGVANSDGCGYYISIGTGITAYAGSYTSKNLVDE